MNLKFINRGKKKYENNISEENYKNPYVGWCTGLQ
jgi:hypothetical protein